MQTRYVLGDAGQSLVVGIGMDPPSHVQNEAASCPAPPIMCNAVSAQLSPNPNPNVIYGALVEGGIFSDTFQASRSPLYPKLWTLKPNLPGTVLSKLWSVWRTNVICYGYAVIRACSSMHAPTRLLDCALPCKHWTSACRPAVTPEWWVA